MNLLLVAFGTYGDLHPMMALGLALQRRGATITLASHPEYRAKVEAAGLPFCPCGPSRDAYVEGLGLSMDDLIRKTAADVTFMFKHLVAPGIVPGVADILDHARAADTIIGTSLAYAGDIAAHLTGTPFAAAVLQPTLLMSVYDPPKMPQAPFVLKPKGVVDRTWNRLIKLAGRLYLERGMGPIRDAYSHHGVTPRFNLSGVTSDRLTLALFSPCLAAPQRDWPPNTQITGTPFYDSEDGRAPVLPAPLAAFLDGGPPPLVFSLGSAAVHAGEAYYRHAVTASQTLGQRCVILCGPDSPLVGQDFGTSVCVTPYAPHSLLLPCALAVVHHGGVGSTAQALRSCRPILTTPVFADQFDNAHRVERLGCGLTLDFARFTAETAATTLGRLLANPAIATTCTAVGREVAAEDGAARAAEIVLGHAHGD